MKSKVNSFLRVVNYLSGWSACTKHSKNSSIREEENYMDINRAVTWLTCIIFCAKGA